MLKYYTFLLLFLTSCIYASKVEIYATTINTLDNKVNAKNGVSVVYRDYILNADSAVYNKNSGDLELFDNITATYKKSYRLLGNYAKLNIIKKEKEFKPFYMLDRVSDVWISADDGSAKDKDITITSGVISGCDQNDPLWKMEFSSSDYNYQTKWINIYNTTLYFYDIPILYTPYFGYSLDTTRRTGLLMPAFGLSSDEGFYYQQPIYVAEYNSWDLELNPQVRSKRGYGLYSKLRFVDSDISSGEFQVGYFKEGETYFKENNLVKNKHSGFNFKYRNSDIINQLLSKRFDAESGLYVDLNGMSDVDYINLESNDKLNSDTSKQILSRINLFFNQDSNYIAMYFKYYQDLTKESNSETLQKLPTFHYHSYLSSLLDNHLLYNLDAKSTNIQRVIDKTALRTDINLPITLQTSLFDEYLSISYNANIYAQYMKFTSLENTLGNSIYRNGYFARNYNTLKLSTDLTKVLSNITHVISFSTKYTKGGNQAHSGYYMDYEELCSDPINKNLKECEFYNITDIDESLELEFTQYLYNSSGRELLYHRLAQKVNYLEGQSTFGELENELDYEIVNGLSIYNNMFYNFDEGSFSKVFNKITLRNKKFTFDISHLYKDSFIPSTVENSKYTSYITSTARYTYDEHYSYKFRYDYDIQESVKKSTEVGFLYTKRCWDFGLRYVENNKPQLTNSGDSSNYERFIYFTIVLKPIMKYSGESSDVGIMIPKDY